MSVYCLASFLRWLDTQEQRDTPYSARCHAMIQLAVEAYRRMQCQCPDCEELATAMHQFWRPR